MEQADFGISTESNNEINIRDIQIDKTDNEIINHLYNECYHKFILKKPLMKENEVMSDNLLK